jgi:two-component system chemotaxis response regulator CheY
MMNCLFTGTAESMVHFKYHNPAVAAAKPDPEAMHTEKTRDTMPSILVVDDEEQIRRLIRETLEQDGYRVTEARDGKEALQQYRLAPADLVIMDILMPDQDGLETTDALRQEFPNVKVIAMTGGSDMIGILNFLDVAKMLGAHRTIQKPFEMKALLETVQAELES